jgi:hypothetical protein
MTRTCLAARGVRLWSCSEGRGAIDKGKNHCMPVPASCCGGRGRRGGNEEAIVEPSWYSQRQRPTHLPASAAAHVAAELCRGACTNRAEIRQLGALKKMDVRCGCAVVKGWCGELFQVVHALRLCM